MALSSDQEEASARRTATIHMIVSVHIPKTGGVSFRKSVLEPIFGDRLLSDYADAPLSRDTPDRIARAQAFEPSPDLPERYDCVHGHFLALKYVSERVPCEFAAWFRDPAQRVVSRYLYGQRKGGGTIAPGMTIREFCEIERFQNTYAKFLWGFDFERFDFVGITEDYASSVELFRRRFGLSGGDEAAIMNANLDKPLGQPYEIDEGLREFIRQRNREDFEIYDAACCKHRRLQHDYLRT